MEKQAQSQRKDLPPFPQILKKRYLRYSDEFVLGPGNRPCLWTLHESADHPQVIGNPRLEFHHSRFYCYCLSSLAHDAEHQPSADDSPIYEQLNFKVQWRESKILMHRLDPNYPSPLQLYSASYLNSQWPM